MTQDDWRKAEKSDGPNEVPEEWTGRCVFRIKWSVTSMPAGVGALLGTGVPMGSVALLGTRAPVDPPGKLVFTDIPEYSLFDGLTGEALPAPLVTIAKREEISEMYRRTVWLEKTIEECLKETGKLPIPVRWVVTNKGDAFHPNLRCRLVAKHLVAKYGGKDMEDLFAAMPPFEMVKALLVKAAQKRNKRIPKRKVRKMMFIDVSKAHLYAPVGPEDKS